MSINDIIALILAGIGLALIIYCMIMLRRATK